MEEGVAPGLGAEAEARRRARAKADFVAGRSPGAFVLAADTVVALDGRILGKPSGGEEALDMLMTLSGRTHRVITAFALLGADFRREGAVTTRVRFREVDEATARRYVGSGEPMGKAGAYAIQGLGGSLVDRVEGSYTNVVGLPIPEALNMLMRCGVLEEGASRPVT